MWFNGGFENKTGKQHLEISIKSLISCIVLHDLEILIHSSKYAIILKILNTFFDINVGWCWNLIPFVRSVVGNLKHLGESRTWILEILENYCPSWKINFLESPSTHLLIDFHYSRSTDDFERYPTLLIIWFPRIVECSDPIFGLR